VAGAFPISTQGSAPKLPHARKKFVRIPGRVEAPIWQIDSNGSIQANTDVVPVIDEINHRRPGRSGAMVLTSCLDSIGQKFEMGVSQNKSVRNRREFSCGCPCGFSGRDLEVNPDD